MVKSLCVSRFYSEINFVVVMVIVFKIFVRKRVMFIEYFYFIDIN